MKYEWEDDCRDALQIAQDMISEFLPKGVVLAGIALAKPEDGQGCFHHHKDLMGDGVTSADIFLDVKGDVEAVYDVTVDGI